MHEILNQIRTGKLKLKVHREKDVKRKELDKTCKVCLKLKLGMGGN